MSPVHFHKSYNKAVPQQVFHSTCDKCVEVRLLIKYCQTLFYFEMNLKKLRHGN